MNPHMDLHQRFVQLGIQRKNLTRQLQALLPEIYKQEIFKKHNCATIYEYAWKFAGFSKSLVEKIIRTSKHLEDKPFLMKAVEKYGVHKVAMVATLATPETDKIFAKHVENMSKPALFEYTKEIRRNQAGVDVNNQGLFEIGGLMPGASGPVTGLSVSSSASATFPCRAVPEKIKIELDDEMQILFLQLKKNLQKEFKRNFSNKEALKIMLKKMLVDGKTAGFKKLSNNGKTVKVKNPMDGGKTANTSAKLAETKSVPGNGLTISAKKTYVPGNGTKAKEALKNDVIQGNEELPTEPYYVVRRVGSDEGDEVEHVFQRFPKSTPPKETAPVEKPLATKGVPRYIKIHQKCEMFAKQKQLEGNTEPAAEEQSCSSGDLIRKCSYPSCNKPCMVIHHRDRFSASKSHDSIIPLCKEHHEFAHNGLIKNETGDPRDWKLNLKPEPNSTDQLVLKYRKS